MIKVIYIDGWNVRSYIEHIEKYLGCQFDYVIYNIVLFLSLEKLMCDESVWVKCGNRIISDVCHILHKLQLTRFFLRI